MEQHVGNMRRAAPTREGDADAGVRGVLLPAAMVARAVHIGPYDRLGEVVYELIREMP
jgi:hypothetical protein